MKAETKAFLDNLGIALPIELTETAKSNILSILREKRTELHKLSVSASKIQEVDGYIEDFEATPVFVPPPQEEVVEEEEEAPAEAPPEEPEEPPEIPPEEPPEAPPEEVPEEVPEEPPEAPPEEPSEEPKDEPPADVPPADA